MNKYMLWRQRGQAKWLTGALVRFDSNSVPLRRGCFTKNPRFKSIDCSAEAICRSSWPIRYGIQKLNRTHTHPTTVTLRRMHTEGNQCHLPGTTVQGHTWPSLGDCSYTEVNLIKGVKDISTGLKDSIRPTVGR